MTDKKLTDIEFVRKFSTCLYKNKRLLLGEVDFSKDFINTDRGDKYPLLFSFGDGCENIAGGEYVFRSENGCAARLLGHLSPYATYESTAEELDGAFGFAFVSGDNKAVVTLKNGADGTVYICGGEKEIKTEKRFRKGMSFSVQPVKERFDAYITDGAFPEYIGSFEFPGFENCAKEDFFTRTQAGFYCEGNVTLKNVSFFMDSGISQADIRTVRYENGEVITENGKIFLTASVRIAAGCYQGVFSWIPGTEEFELTGALFFDAGDGVWENDVATSLIFDRKTKKWLLWVCAFSHGHILGHAGFEADPRYGKNVIDITLVPELSPDDPDEKFGGRSGDEDPDLFFDEDAGKWRLAVCRTAKNEGYCYFFFESDSPFGGFRFTGRGVKGAETGGSFFRYHGRLYFICGNSFEKHSDYRVYEWGKPGAFLPLKADFPDGGFRGWGTVFTVKQGTREKLYHLTFDRHNGSAWNWSYGNIYCFEGR